VRSMGNLASTYRDQGRTGEAAALQEEVMEKHRQILGAEHPNTLTSMNNLALTYRDQGKTGEAAALQEEAAALRALREGGSESSRSNKKIEGMRKGLQLMQ
jgi:hypothetical protein